MSDPNLYISNGTCYTAPGEALDNSFIPCGNSAFGHQTCCGAGDNCLADNSCFGVHGQGYGSQLTYMAGCTDPLYGDAKCPDKKGIDQPWIALTLCDNTDVWAACSQAGDPTTLQPGSYCSCTQQVSATVAFTDSTRLAWFASLPRTTGGSIQFAADHMPTAPPPPPPPPPAGSSATPIVSRLTVVGPANTIVTEVTVPAPTQASTGPANTGGTPQTGSTPSQTGTSVGTSTSTETGAVPPPNSSANSVLGSGAKIGIGVGVAVGVLLLLALLTLVLLRRRKRRRAVPAPDPEPEKGAPDDKPAGIDAAGRDASRTSNVSTATTHLSEKDGKPVSKADTPGVSELDSSTVVEAEGQTAHPWDKGSELDGRQVEPERAELPLSPIAELPGSLLRQTSGREEGAAAWRMR